MPQGIYEIVNLYDGRASAYIGGSVDIEHRWEQHRSALCAGQHRNAHLQAAWDKYGEDAFVFSMLEEVGDKMLLVMEQEYLDDYFDRGHCYNIATIAGASTKGHKCTEETRRKMSKAHKGCVKTVQHRRRLSESLKGRVLSEEHRHKLSECQKGRVFSEEHQRKLREIRKGREPWNKGMKLSPLSEEHKRKISESLKGKQSALVGRKMSEEHKRNISKAQKRVRAKKKKRD